MPKIDPITGCQVMTMGEFLTAEGEREGKEPWEIMDEIFSELEEDNRRVEQEWSNPDEALKIIQKTAKEILECWQEDKQHDGEVDEYTRWDWQNEKWVQDRRVFEAGPKPPMPVKVLDVLEVEHHQNFKGSHGSLRALCECDDGRKLVFVWSFEAFSGDFYEPPWGEENLDWSSP